MTAFSTRLIDQMKKRGWIYNKTESKLHQLRFDHENGLQPTPKYYDSWRQIYDMIKVEKLNETDQERKEKCQE